MSKITASVNRLEGTSPLIRVDESILSVFPSWFDFLLYAEAEKRRPLNFSIGQVERVFFLGHDELFSIESVLKHLLERGELDKQLGYLELLAMMKMGSGFFRETFGVDNGIVGLKSAMNIRGANIVPWITCTYYGPVMWWVRIEDAWKNCFSTLQFR